MHTKICMYLIIAPFVSFTPIQASLGAQYAAENISEMAPTIMVKQQLGDVGGEAFLVSEREVICKVPVGEIPLYLLSAFYSFNMQYPRGLTSLYTLLEILLFNIRPKKVPQIVSGLLTWLEFE